MQVKSFTFNPFQENTYVLFDETKSCIIVDPGCESATEENYLFDFISENELQPELIVNTHNHIDHVLGINAVHKKYNIPFWCHPLEIEGLERVPLYAPTYGMNVQPIKGADKLITEADTVQFGKTSLSIRFTPGHSSGSICLIQEDAKIIIAGDVLFLGSIGRTDLPGGDYTTLMESIRTQLLTLDDDMAVYPGHGPATSIGQERVTNPFILDYLSKL